MVFNGVALDGWSVGLFLSIEKAKPVRGQKDSVAWRPAGGGIWFGVRALLQGVTQKHTAVGRE